MVPAWAPTGLCVLHQVHAGVRPMHNFVLLGVADMLFVAEWLVMVVAVVVLGHGGIVFQFLGGMSQPWFPVGLERQRCPVRRTGR